MATIQTIATTLTNDARPAVSSLRAFEGEVDKTFTRLDARTKRFNATSAEAMLGGSGGAGRGRNFASGFLELSRGLEDASVGFQLNGLQGAVRGASNNLSTMAFIMGGPVAGAIAGLTAAALPSLVNWLSKSKEATRDFAKETEFALTLLEKSQKAVERQVGFRQSVRGLGSPEDAAAAMRRRVDEIEIINNKINDIEGRRAGRNRFIIQNPQLFDAKEVEAAADADRRMFLQGLEHMRERKRLEEEINQIREKRAELDKVQIQKDQEQFAGIIRGFQEDDLKQQERDNERLQGLLRGRLNALGVKSDPLEGMDIPDELRGRIRALLGDDASGRSGQLAQVATADSQSMLRSQYQAKESAERRKAESKLQKAIEDILRELREARRGIADDDKDDVNLN